MPTPVTKENQQPSEKLRIASARRSTTGRLKLRLRMMKPTPAMPERAGGDGLVAEPVPTRAFLQHIFQTAEKQGEQHDAEITAPRNSAKCGLSMRTSSGTRNATR